LGKLIPAGSAAEARLRQRRWRLVLAAIVLVAGEAGRE
jgi:hypothetical protein